MAGDIRTESQRPAAAVRRTKDGTPMNLFLVLTFGGASCLHRGLFESREDAENTMREIRQNGGAPKLYECTLLFTV